MRLCAFVAALALGVPLASCGGGGGGGGGGGAGGPAAAQGTGTSTADPVSTATPHQLATSAARSFLDTYTTDGGRIQRTDQGGDTVGEGQSYGMLMAAAIGDRQRFDEIWSWTQRHMVQPSGLLAFHWEQGRVVDPTPAADADLDAARALLLGACRFGEPELRRQAIRIGRAILARETATAGRLKVLIAGPWANKGQYVVFNASYPDPTTLDALAQASGNAEFRAVANGSAQLVNALTKPLPPDWATVSTATGSPTPVSGASATSGPGLFSYDAPRALIRFAAGSDTDRSGIARAWGVFKETQPQDIVTEHQLSGTPVGTAHDPITVVAAAGAAKAAGDSAAVARLLDVAQQLNAQHPTYYGAAWVALGRLMLTTKLLVPCAG